MTLIIAGHQFEHGISWGNEDPKLELNGLFVASDSAITDSNNKTLLGGFKKVYAVPIRVWKPYFIGEYFRSYRDVYYHSDCFIAIAGSTLTAQHVINLISEHLANLRLTHFSSTEGSSARYGVVPHCGKNPLEVNHGIDTWDDSMFTDRDFSGVITGDVFDEVIEHSINTALKSARKYKLDEDSLRQMYTEFAVGIYCPVSHRHRLFEYKTAHRLNAEGIYEVFAEKMEVFPNNLVVLGMANRFKAGAQARFAQAMSSGTPPAPVMFEFLNEAIDQVRASGRPEIDRPSFLRHYKDGKLE